MERKFNISDRFMPSDYIISKYDRLAKAIREIKNCSSKQEINIK